MQGIPVNLEEVGARLVAERKRIGLNQTDMGAIGGVSRASQTEYENGKTHFTARYLLQLGERGVDVSFVLTGHRTVSQLDEETAELVECFQSIGPADQVALLTVARSMRVASSPSNRIHGGRSAFHGENG